MRMLLTAAVFALDLGGIVSILGAHRPARSKVLWVVLVVAVPLVGFAIWWLAGRRASIPSERS
jgi:hypothetical protein